jgi:hypothetical protein
VKLLCGLATLAVVAMTVTAVHAASFTLDARAIQQAVAVGEQSTTHDTVGDEWRQRNAAGHVLIVMTPFHRLALAARDAAFRKEPLKPGDISRLLKSQRDRLVLWLELRGPREDFARFYAPRLTFDGRQIEPAFVQNERTAARLEDGRFLAHCVYAFPTKVITETSKLALAVRDGDGHEVTTFSIDLASMR